MELSRVDWPFRCQKLVAACHRRWQDMGMSRRLASKDNDYRSLESQTGKDWDKDHWRPTMMELCVRVAMALHSAHLRSHRFADHRHMTSKYMVDTPEDNSVWWPIDTVLPFVSALNVHRWPAMMALWWWCALTPDETLSLRPERQIQRLALLNEW